MNDSRYGRFVGMDVASAKLDVFDASNTARRIAERHASWELAHTVASTFDGLPLEHPHALPLPAT